MTSALLSCPVPPDPDTFAGSIMLSLATGTSTVSEVRDAYTALADGLSPEQFKEYFPKSEQVAAADVAGIVDEAAAAHRAVVTQLSDDAAKIMRVLVDASNAGLVVEFGDAIDDDDAIELARQIKEAEEVASPGEFWGFVYADAQDLEEMVLTGRLSLGYGTFADDRPEEDAAMSFLSLLREHGLTAHHDADTNELVVEDVTFEVPLED